MFAAGALSIFVLGLRHGADPDHLAAIDNLTRSAYAVRPYWSRFVGALFALGHSAMVIVLAALVGLLGTRLGRQGPILEYIGGWLSVIVLLTIAAFNLSKLHHNGGTAFVGARVRLLPRRLLTGGPLLAVPVGLLFGLGFETSSQIAVYGVALGVNSGVVGAALVGSIFCLGMIVTDTLDSLLLHRLISTQTSLTPWALRTWVIAVTSVAVVVGFFEGAELLGWHPPFSDLTISATLVSYLMLTFAYVVGITTSSVLARRGDMRPTLTVGKVDFFLTDPRVYVDKSSGGRRARKRDLIIARRYFTVTMTRNKK